jgi:hypothetical protein
VEHYRAYFGANFDDFQRFRVNNFCLLELPTRKKNNTNVYQFTFGKKFISQKVL